MINKNKVTKKMFKKMFIDAIHFTKSSFIINKLNASSRIEKIFCLDHGHCGRAPSPTITSLFFARRQQHPNNKNRHFVGGPSYERHIH